MYSRIKSQFCDFEGRHSTDILDILLQNINMNPDNLLWLFLSLLKERKKNIFALFQITKISRSHFAHTESSFKSYMVYQKSTKQVINRD